jgi:hypothetical protein
MFNLVRCRDPSKSAVRVSSEIAEQTRLPTNSGTAPPGSPNIALPNTALCASPLMVVAHGAPIAREFRFGAAVVVLPVYNLAGRRTSPGASRLMKSSCSP